MLERDRRIENIIYFGSDRLPPTYVGRPLNLVFLTSVRDTGICDRNGIMVETGNGREYMEGAIERIVRETRPWWRGSSELVYAGMLADVIRVAGVITDDTEHDMRGSSYSILPGSGSAWIYPLDLATPDGQLLRDMTFNIPSTFRKLRLEAKGERRELKYDFEKKVLQKMRELGGDILVSDHLMVKLDYLYKEPSLYASVLNIHPAITKKDHPFCFRGKTPTADAIARARTDVLTRTGATLHLINERIDDGPIMKGLIDMRIFYSAKTKLHDPLYEINNGEKISHPENSKRVEVILNGLLKEGFQVEEFNSRIPFKLLTEVHSKDFVHFVKKLSNFLKKGERFYPDVFLRERMNNWKSNLALMGQYSFDVYTPITHGTYQAAIAAASLAFRGAFEIANGQEKKIYALTHPIGHHALPNKMGGYIVILIMQP